MLTQSQKDKIEEYINVYDSSLLSNEFLSFVMDDSAETLSPACFGNRYEKAVALLTMHTLTIATQTTEGTAGEGFVIQRTIGPITIRWADPNNGKDRFNYSYRTTKYGIELADLIKLCSVGAGFSVNHAWRFM